MAVDRKELEKQFFDKEAQHDKFDFRKLVKYEYFTTTLSDRMLAEIRCRSCRTLLFYGCGQESGWLKEVKRDDLKVAAFDISLESTRAIARAIRQKGYDHATAFQMDAEYLAFSDHSFDIICGKSILHHLELPASLKEIRRVLKPGGIAIFSEPLGFNPILNIFRNLTPSSRTDFEHPFNKKDLADIASAFADWEIQPYFLISMLLLPISVLLPHFLMRPIFKAMLAFDARLFRLFPAFGRHAWSCLVMLRAKP